jgi:hypothetical protein
MNNVNMGLNLNPSVDTVFQQLRQWTPPMTGVYIHQMAGKFDSFVMVMCFVLRLDARKK